MSGFRRHLLARIATSAVQPYISGTSTLYNSSFTFQLQLVGGVMTTYTATTDSNGDWRVDFNVGDKVRSMQNAFYTNINVTSIDLHTMDFSQCETFSQSFYGCKYLEKIIGVESLVTSSCTSCHNMFRSCYSLKYDSNSPMDLSAWDTSNVTSMYFFMGASNVDKNTWIADTGNYAFYQCLAVNLPSIPSGCNTNGLATWQQGLQDIATCGAIGAVGGIAFTQSTNLTLASAIVILSALQDLQGGSATLTFSSSTLALIQASINNGDVDTISAVTNAIDNGWTITGLNVIDGYAYDNQGVYPANVTFKVNGSNTTVVVNSNNGYFIYAISNLNYLNEAFRNNESVESVRVYAPNAAIPMNYFSRRSKIKSVECTGVTATSISIAFGLAYAEYSNGDRQPLTSLKLPRITNSTMSTSGSCVVWCTNLFDVQCDFIENDFNCAQSPLSLQSAINILSALQDVTSYGGKTLTFSSTTKGYINNDQDALALVANAVNNLGWTIALT